MEQKKSTKVLIILSGLAFLGSSIAGLGGLIASSINKPNPKENSAHSQNAQFEAQEKGFLGVLKREPNNPTALRGAIEIWRMRVQQGDAQGVKKTIEGLVKDNPKNKQYQDLLVAINQQIAATKNPPTPKIPDPQKSAPPSK